MTHKVSGTATGVNGTVTVPFWGKLQCVRRVPSTSRRLHVLHSTAVGRRTSCVFMEGYTPLSSRHIPSQGQFKCTLRKAQFRARLVELSSLLPPDARIAQLGPAL